MASVIKNFSSKNLAFFKFIYAPYKTSFAKSRYAGTYPQYISIVTHVSSMLKPLIIIVLAIKIIKKIEKPIIKFILSFLPHQQRTLMEVTLAETVQKSFTGHSFFKATLAICLGGLVLGILFGKLSCLIHQYILKRTVVTYEEFIQQKIDDLNRLKKDSDDFIGKV